MQKFCSIYQKDDLFYSIISSSQMLCFLIFILPIYHLSYACLVDLFYASLQLLMIDSRNLFNFNELHITATEIRSDLSHLLLFLFYGEPSIKSPAQSLFWRIWIRAFLLSMKHPLHLGKDTILCDLKLIIFENIYGRNGLN